MSLMNENILVTRNLCKKYGKSFAVKNLNLTVKKGDIYGLVGKMELVRQPL